jgi:prefoldin subunit 5
VTPAETLAFLAARVRELEMERDALRREADLLRERLRRAERELAARAEKPSPP